MAGHSGSDSAQRRRDAALAGYRGAADADAAHAAEAAQGDPDPKVRIAALRSLARIGAAANEPVRNEQITRALDDAEPSVRIAAIEIAAGQPEPGLLHLLDDEDSMVVETTAWALGERETAGETIIDRLSRVARDHHDPLARESAVAALGAIGDDRGLGAVLGATRDKVAIRRRAVIALAAFEGAEVSAAFARARHDRDRQVRDAVEELLGPDKPDEEG
ncbi:MAG: HEAT repeat domain-containing protein [Acidimicrobiaceae bacterium]|nr:HEAT repeat domain-containing protein [Acidimicrobiaceae bacterium]MDE0605551.1 HEAT repeat domain-containing protein [Acidimicrobiaceae bacterium]